MTDLRQAAQQALEALEELDGLDTETECVTIDVGDVIAALRTALKQQAEPPPEWESIKNILDEYGLDAIAFVKAWKAVQQRAEPVAWTLTETLNKRETTTHGYLWFSNPQNCSWTPLYTTPPQQQAEPVAMRLPKVGDKVICLEDESLGTVESLTAGGSPDIVFDDGSRGTYLLREFAELFGYVTTPQQQAEPVAYDKLSASFNEWWDSYRHDPANPFAEGSAAYWAWAGWKSAQRQWVGLTDEDCTRMSAGDKLVAMWAEAKLKEKNSD